MIVENTMRTVVPASLAHVYVKDFGGNHAAAADYAGISIYTLKRPLQGILIAEEHAAALLSACYKRLGREVVDRILHPQVAVNGTSAAAPPAAKLDSAWGPITILDAPAPTKVCVACKQEFPATLGNFARHAHAKDGLQGYCRTCHRKSAQVAWAVGRQRKADKAAAPSETAVPTQEDATTVHGAGHVPAPSLSAALLALAADVERLEQELADVGPLRAENARLTALVAEKQAENAALWQQLAALKARG